MQYDWIVSKSTSLWQTNLQRILFFSSGTVWMAKMSFDTILKEKDNQLLMHSKIFSNKLLNWKHTSFRLLQTYLTTLDELRDNDQIQLISVYVLGWEGLCITHSINLNNSSLRFFIVRIGCRKVKLIINRMKKNERQRKRPKETNRLIDSIVWVEDNKTRIGMNFSTIHLLYEF